MLHINLNTKNLFTKERGFTLLEIMLVTVIAATIIVMIVTASRQQIERVRIEKTTIQMQQVLNAGLEYYASNGKWPKTILGDDEDSLNTFLGLDEDATYLALNSFGGATAIENDPEIETDVRTFKISTEIEDENIAEVIAAKLPFGDVIEGDDDTPYKVIAQITIPGTNYNNAGAIQYSDIFHSQDCVAKPDCPFGMEPSILVFPVKIFTQGNWVTYRPDPDKGLKIRKFGITPITSFAVYAQNNKGACDVTSKRIPKGCINAKGKTDEDYWRICISTQGSTNQEGQELRIEDRRQEALVITRCIPGKTETS